MDRRGRRLRMWALTWCATMLLAGCAASPSTEPQGGGTPPTTGGGDAEALVSEKCSQCHSIDRVDAAVKDEGDWRQTVQRMERNGLEVTDAERDAIVQWLAERDANR